MKIFENDKLSLWVGLVFDKLRQWNTKQSLRFAVGEIFRQKQAKTWSGKADLIWTLKQPER